MDFAFTEDQLAIKDSVGKLCARFDGKYWIFPTTPSGAMVWLLSTYVTEGGRAEGPAGPEAGIWHGGGQCEFRQCVITRILFAASTRSLLLISLVTAAAISGVMARCRDFSVPSSVSSLRMNSRNSPTVMLLMLEKLS